jgi:hypothetical protein
MVPIVPGRPAGGVDEQFDDVEDGVSGSCHETSIVAGLGSVIARGSRVPQLDDLGVNGCLAEGTGDGHSVVAVADVVLVVDAVDGDGRQWCASASRDPEQLPPSVAPRRRPEASVKCLCLVALGGSDDRVERDGLDPQGASLGAGFELVGKVEELALVGRPLLEPAGQGGESALAREAGAGVLGVCHQQAGDRPCPVDDQKDGGEAEQEAGEAAECEGRERERGQQQRRPDSNVSWFPRGPRKRGSGEPESGARAHVGPGGASVGCGGSLSKTAIFGARPFRRARADVIGAAPSWSVLHFVVMPTTRPRLTITETDELAEALDAAAARWPEVGSRRELLLRLVEQGRAVIERDREMWLERRRAAIRGTSGALTGVYEPGYLERLRDDWPA